MKAKKLIMPLLLLCIALFAMVGCSNTPNDVIIITDIEFYSDMQEETDKIEVKFDNNTGKYFEFTIENKKDIAEIMNIVLNDKLNNFGNGAVAPTGNTSITIYQGEQAYGVAINGVVVNGNHYAFSSSTELQSKIRNLAIAQGAYDTEVGVIYKVIALQDIDIVGEEKTSVADKIAMLALLENSYGDCEYFYLFDSENLAEQYYSSGITENELAAYQYKNTVTMGNVDRIFRNASWNKSMISSLLVDGAGKDAYIYISNNFRVFFKLDDEYLTHSSITLKNRAKEVITSLYIEGKITEKEYKAEVDLIDTVKINYSYSCFYSTTDFPSRVLTTFYINPALVPFDDYMLFWFDFVIEK